MDFTQRRIVQRKVEVVLLQYIPGGALDRAVANVVETMGAITGPDNLSQKSWDVNLIRHEENDERPINPTI